MTESSELKEALEFVEWAQDPTVRMQSGARAHMVAQTLAEAYLRLKEAGKRKEAELKTMANKYTELGVALKDAEAEISRLEGLLREKK